MKLYVHGEKGETISNEKKVRNQNIILRMKGKKTKTKIKLRFQDK